jgi:hypothetical protein
MPQVRFPSAANQGECALRHVARTMHTRPFARSRLFFDTIGVDRSECNGCFDERFGANALLLTVSGSPKQNPILCGLTRPIHRNIYSVVQSFEGRVMTVFIAQGWMRWPPRCRPRECFGSRDRSARLRGKTPAKRADGPSACPGNSLHDRGRVSSSDANCDMQQAAKSIRVRSAGGFSRLRRSRGCSARRIVCSVRAYSAVHLFGMYGAMSCVRQRVAPRTRRTVQRSARSFGRDGERRPACLGPHKEKRR